MEKRVQASQTIMLIDGMSLLFRGYYATAYSGRIMRTSAGVPVNGIHGFMNYFLDAIETFAPTHVVCCWDMGSQTFRTDRYDQYKANRGAPPDELRPQFDLIKDVMDSFGVPNIGLSGYEADDCIGTLSRLYSEDADTKVQILTGDHDSLQLLKNNVHVIIMKKGVSNYAVYTPEVLFEEKGVRPEQLVDVKALMGDSSDNYPGVKGIGEKTAYKLVCEYGSVAGILDNLADLAPGVRRKIETELAMLHLSRELAEIDVQVPIACLLEDCCWMPDTEQVRQQFEALELRAFLKRLG
ncbi:5'-3' exonuclease [Aneurinibacillus soli]|uniref:5'-3' exonuclease n=1 Tax=Aneurinibacillus soli TaxID=1500254 RepID=A0A0U5AZP0_9BACL|nr:5'-3' exonuclease [Aneurinibacillus soli]BAU27472.1 5'-3' exonuclease [Aneurinibacillus soli]